MCHFIFLFALRQNSSIFLSVLMIQTSLFLLSQTTCLVIKRKCLIQIFGRNVCQIYVGKLTLLINIKLNNYNLIIYVKLKFFKITHWFETSDTPSCFIFNPFKCTHLKCTHSYGDYECFAHAKARNICSDTNSRRSETGPKKSVNDKNLLCNSIQTLIVRNKW